MPEVFIALGANLGDPEHQLKEALARLRETLWVERVSSLYRTEPIGFREQPDFLNAVIAARTERTPRDVLALLVEIERALGRTRDVPQGPRTLDLDLLLYGDLRVAEPDLMLPHPRMTQRRFVLEPIAEIAPRLPLPGLGRTAAELLAALPPGGAVERLDRADWPPEIAME